VMAYMSEPFAGSPRFALRPNSHSPFPHFRPRVCPPAPPISDAFVRREASGPGAFAVAGAGKALSSVEIRGHAISKTRTFEKPGRPGMLSGSPGGIRGGTKASLLTADFVSPRATSNQSQSAVDAGIVGFRHHSGNRKRLATDDADFYLVYQHSNRVG
jgi:hypothetical protein